jgi:hypothetical protein
MVHTIDKNRNIRTAEDEWNSAVDFSTQSNAHRLLETLLTTYQRTDNDLETIYEQTHINTATGAELDQFGELVNVDRKTNESDEKFRARIKATFRASTMGTTFDQFTEFCAETINTDISNLEFTTPYESNPATVEISAPSTIYDSANFSNEEIVSLFEKGVPAGHKVNVISVSDNVFQLKSDGDTDEADKGLTSDSIDTGGKLIADIV